MTSPMVPWPENVPTGIYESECDTWDAFEAAMQRLRVAVEALEKVEELLGALSPVDFVDSEQGERYAAKSHDIAWAARAAIGSLPNDDAKGAG